jgi:LytS/YehU family sensor histidine kinase
VIGLLGWVIFKIFDIVSERKKTLEAIKTEQVKNQLETLKSQINPHFLFNSFNTLISVIEYKPEQAVTFVEKLSDFYRSILQYRETEFISLEEEVTIMENYRFLLEQRFGKSIEISVNISNPKTYMILPLTLQLLIENAVKHNVVSKNKPLIIHITQTDENLKICNNLQPKLSVEVSTHFGLQSLSKRYLYLLGKDIIINKTADEFCITIPLKKTI